VVSNPSQGSSLYVALPWNLYLQTLVNRKLDVSHESHVTYGVVSHDLLIEVALGDGNEVGVDGSHDSDEGRLPSQG
jgi:hypothetical protein